MNAFFDALLCRIFDCLPSIAVDSFFMHHPFAPLHLVVVQSVDMMSDALFCHFGAVNVCTYECTCVCVYSIQAAAIEKAHRKAAALKLSFIRWKTASRSQESLSKR